MTHWFHRNALKSTTSQSFNLSLISAEPKAIKICELLRQTRNQLIESMTDPSTDQSLVEQQLIKYLSLLQGFIASHHLDHRYGPNDSSKLRHYITFKWTNSLLGSTPEVQQDSIFELISISYEYAIWLMKHSSQLAAKQDISMDEAKQVHKCLRKAAGVLTQLKNNWFDRLLHKKFEPGSDLDHRVANCYIITCQAEAQEVTIGRAIELKHSSTLISGLANETSKLFLESASAIKTLDQTKFGKWITYLQLKSAFYESYAFCYLGQSLLEQEKCGEAIRALEESEKFYEIAVKLCKDYTKIKSIGTSAKIDEHLFFRKLRPLVTRIKDKCIRENGFIFHQKVPKECPALELKATHGLVTPEEFIIPPIHELWTPESYSAFDLSKNINLKDTANSKATAAEDPLPPVDEKPIKSNGSDPKNESGCRIQ